MVAWVPVPVRDQQRFELSSAVRMTVSLLSEDYDGAITSDDDAALIADADLEIVARALVANRRNDSNESVPSVETLATALGCSTRTVYNRLQALSALRPIAMLAGPPRSERLDRAALADALVRSYPYLLLDVPQTL